AYLRLFGPYGPDDNDKLVTFLVKSLRAHTPLTLTPGEQQWNFTYVGDIVEAFMKAIEFVSQPDGSSEVFNIGATETHSIKEVVETLEAVSGEHTEVSYTKPYPPNEIFYVNCDGLKAKQVLGWEARTSLRDGLRATWEFNPSQ
ncbi:MAG TPA: NAD-dependent epimerase/dehydratase family protein, partial [Patescibacteria group bacterium]|nr:NAD-dependent epimerase/dehydratase family protein [Patescibacteria group bacterium]